VGRRGLLRPYAAAWHGESVTLCGGIHSVKTDGLLYGGGLSVDITALSSADGRARPLIIMCAAVAWDGLAHADRMLALALLEHARILWVDPANWNRAPLSDQQASAPQFDRPIDGVIRLRPWAFPLSNRTGLRWLRRALLRLHIRRTLRHLGETPYAVVDLCLAGVLGGWGSAVCNVLYGTDDYVAGAYLMGLREANIRSAERFCLARADVVIAVSTALADRWNAMGATVEVIPNGVNIAGCTETDPAYPLLGIDLPRPVVGVVGYLSSRIDIELLEALASSGLSLLLVGARDPRWEPKRFGRLIGNSNVAWAGLQPAAAVPTYLRVFDVGITPYLDTEFNRASFPLKTLEYLAAGLPVVSTDLPATRWLETELVRVATGPADFVAAVKAAASDPHDGDLRAARREFAARHAWSERAAKVAAVLQLPSVRIEVGRRADGREAW
jgi:teichuronic acid biosynthesis glycosyltransferase TuaH